MNAQIKEAADLFMAYCLQIDPEFTLILALESKDPSDPLPEVMIMGKAALLPIMAGEISKLVNDRCAPHIDIFRKGPF